MYGNELPTTSSASQLLSAVDDGRVPTTPVPPVV